MKKALAIAVSALALSGCSSYHEIARWNYARPLENGEVPVGSDRVAQLETFEDDHSAWSLFIFNRHEVRTKCIILPPEPPADAAGK